MRTRAAVLSLALAGSVPAAAQLRPSWSAAARLTEASVGPSDPALWFGGRLEWSRPGASLEAAAAGGTGWRGRFGGEIFASGLLARPLRAGLDLRAAMKGAAEQPIGRAAVGEISSRLGLRGRLGAVAVEGGGLLLGQARETSGAYGGAYLATEIALGPVTLTGDIGQLAVLSGSLGSGSLGNQIPGSVLTGGGGIGDSGQDTLSTSPSQARRLSHALFGARVSHGVFELYTSILRRTRLELGESFGWEAGVAIGPIAGTRLRIGGGRMPAPATIYLPYRKQLAIGVELLGRTPREPAPGGTRSAIGFDVLLGAATEAATIVVRHPTALRVEVAGDFSSWEPIRLIAVVPGVFEGKVTLPAGSHQINVRFDGGGWEVPPGFGSAPDGFGGKTGVLIVR
jgi:hypothetical protein